MPRSTMRRQFSFRDLDRALVNHEEEDEEDSEDSELARAIAAEENLPISSTQKFNAIVGMVIVTNTVLVSMECLLIQHDKYKPYFAVGETIFTCLYMLEIGIRIKELGLVTFFFGEDFSWNWFDFLVTVAGLMDSITMYLGTFMATAQMHGAASTRLFRMLRIMRLFRTFKFIADLDFVLATAASATVKLAVLVLLLLLVSSIITTNILWDAPDDHLQNRFGNLARSMWTLFKLMTLEEWIPLVERVERINPEMRVFFILFIFFGSIALMPLVPAVFVELQLIDRNKIKEEKANQRRTARRRSRKELLHRLFELADKDCDGNVTIAELQDALEDEDVREELTSKFSISMVVGDGEGRHKSLHSSLGLNERGDIRDLKFGVFLFWADKLFEMQELGDEDEDEENEVFGEHEFVRGMLQIWGDVDLNVIWRNITATRIYLMANGGCGGSKVARRFCGNPDRWGDIFADGKQSKSISPFGSTASLVPKARRGAVGLGDASMSPYDISHSPRDVGAVSTHPATSRGLSRGMTITSLGMSEKSHSFNAEGFKRSAAGTDLSAELKLMNAKLNELNLVVGGLASEVALETAAMVDASWARLLTYMEEHLKLLGGSAAGAGRDESFSKLREKFASKNSFGSRMSSGSTVSEARSPRDQVVQSWLPTNLRGVPALPASEVSKTSLGGCSEISTKNSRLRWRETAEYHEYPERQLSGELQSKFKDLGQQADDEVANVGLQST